jgi:CRISPR/Cas system CSM-associated protein Csm2 small subunit
MNKGTVDENSFDGFLNRMKEYGKYLKGTPAETQFVSFELFKQTMELNTENLRQLYSMIHDINMQKAYTIELDMGGIKFAISGEHKNSDNVVKAAEKLIDKLTKKFYTKEELQKMSKQLSEGKTSVEKGYC